MKSSKPVNYSLAYSGRKEHHLRMQVLRTIKRLVFKNRKTKIAALLTTLGLCAGTAFAAYVIINNTGSGSGTEQLGTAATSVPMKFTVAWVPGSLTPGDSASVYVGVQNSNSVAGNVTPANLTGTFTTDTQGCDPSWFTFTPATGLSAQTIPANNAGTGSSGGPGNIIPSGSGTILAGGQPVGSIKFADNASAQQDACSGANLTLTLSDSQG
jgi:hypothetical protein